MTINQVCGSIETMSKNEKFENKPNLRDIDLSPDDAYRLIWGAGNKTLLSLENQPLGVQAGEYFTRMFNLIHKVKAESEEAGVEEPEINIGELFSSVKKEMYEQYGDIKYVGTGSTLEPHDLTAALNNAEATDRIRDSIDEAYVELFE